MTIQYIVTIISLNHHYFGTYSTLLIYSIYITLISSILVIVINLHSFNLYTIEYCHSIYLAYFRNYAKNI